MNRNVLYIAAALAGASLMAGCAADEPFGLKGEGRVQLSTNISSKVTAVSRASSTEQELAESTVVWVSNAKGAVRKFASLGDIPADGIKLLADHYVAEAWAGDSVPASFTDRYFYGKEEFTVSGGTTAQVTVTCHVANSVVAVNYTEDVDDVLSDYSLTVGHSQGELTFNGRDDRRAYFMMNSRDKDLQWTLTGKLRDGSTFERTGTIADARPATLYTLNVRCDQQDEVIGGAYLTIEIDETTDDVEDEFNIIAAPTIAGFGFDINKPVTGEKSAVGRHSIWASANGDFASLVLECADFDALLGIGGNDFDIFNMDAKYTEMLQAGGIVYSINKSDETGSTGVKVTFEEAFTSRLDDGDHTVTITAVDANGKRAAAVLTFSVTDAPVSVAEVAPASVWSNRATVGGSILKAGVAPALKYRPRTGAAIVARGDDGWMYADNIVVNGDSFTAELSGLLPGTTYEYVATTADGSFTSPDVRTFTTEAEAQIPNGDFEGWSMSGSVQMLYAAGATAYWDSGNHGSTTAPSILGGGNITTPYEDLRHSGNYSIRMESKSIFSILAAGNAFVGEYLGTEGTNGVLGWGKPFTARPSKVRGWVKYTPAKVSSTSDKAPDIVSGQDDKGIIYLALLDDSKGPKYGNYSGSANYPVVVKTKSPGQYFSKDDSNVIAYGEIVFDAATAGDGLIEFEFPLEYFHTDRKAAYLLCTMSASKGGDYFAGASGSVMIVDDLELIYE